MGRLYTLEELTALITRGSILVVAATQELLRKLPQGNWVGGLANRFAVEGECIEDNNRLFAFDLTESISGFQIRSYLPHGLGSMYKEHYQHGFSVVLLPAFSKTLSYFSLMSSVQTAGDSVPLCGWVSGIDLEGNNAAEPLAVDGSIPYSYHDRAVVLHCAVPFRMEISADLVCPFIPGDGDSIVFESSGFVMREAIINGTRQPLAPYWQNLAAQGRTGPLITQLRGIPVTVAALPPYGKHAITFCSSVLPNLEYRMAAPVASLAGEFQRLSQSIPTDPLISLYSPQSFMASSSQGRNPFGLGNGIFTLGEIGSLLFNLTDIHLTVTDRK